MASYQLKTEIIRREELAGGIIRLTFNAPDIARLARPGQFLMVKGSGSVNTPPLLRRPFSIHQASGNERVQILFKVVGPGTLFLSERKRGDIIDVVGPLGKGFSIDRGPAVAPLGSCLVGGGMGIAPLYFLAKHLLRSDEAADLVVLLGAATARDLQVLKGDFEALGVKCMVATDDGSLGHHGFVTSLLENTLEPEKSWRVYSCGPHPMMAMVAQIATARGWGCQVSLETMMACGISSCLGCTVKVSGDLAKRSGKLYMHVCKDGPVFDAGDVAWK